MRICGSCYSLVTAEGGTTACPRCGKALEPTATDRLAKFVANGTDPSTQGVKLRDAQRAAQEVLDLLARVEADHECCWHDGHGHGALGDCAVTERRRALDSTTPED